MTDKAVRPRWTTAPCFTVADVVATANYYRDKLGFTYERFWGEPPSFSIVQRNGVSIMLGQPPANGVAHPNHASAPDAEFCDAYVWIDDADALHAEYQAKGARIVFGVCDQPYGCREFAVEDCNGYHVYFGQPIA